MSAAQSRPLARSHAAANSFAALCGNDRGDGRLVGLGGRGGEGERDLGQAELEHAIAAARLAVVFALRRRRAQDLYLPIVETETAVDPGDLRLERALIRQKNPRSDSFR